MLKVLGCILLIFATGCGTPAYVDQASYYAKQGDCQSALRTIEGSGEWAGRRHYMVAGIYANCYRNQAQAVQWATLSARYDVQAARDYLARVGAPIPRPDLYQNGREFTAADGALAFTTGFNKSMKGPAVSCTSKAMPSGSVWTDCN